MSYGMGDSIKSLVANDKSIFKIVIFHAQWETIKLTDSQLEIVSKFKEG